MVLLFCTIVANATTYRVKYDVNNQSYTSFIVRVESNRLTIGSNAYLLRRMVQSLVPALVSKYKSAKVSTYREQSNHVTNKEPIITEIPFTKEDGICKVKCQINGLPLHFVFDTGASDVALSMVEATFMMKNGYLSKNDVIGNQRYMNANGDVNVGTVINIKNVNFGGLNLNNIRASVVRNQKAPLLLGQSVLARLGKIEIDNAKNVIKITQ